MGVAVIGAGPAGLTAAHVLSTRKRKATVIEADSVVGGIAKTVEFEGYRFDLGGHRFYTKIRPVQRLWEEAMGDEFLVRSRKSRIFYRGRFFNYPLRAEDVFKGLGIIESARCALSYLWGRYTWRRRTPATFEEWVVSRFGRRIYEDFFRSYTQKVWGIPGSEIQSEWAAQRIQNFSLWQAMLGILRLRRGKVTTLIEEFHYPRLGPGQLWERFEDRLNDEGIPVRKNERCVAIRHSGGAVTGITTVRDGAEIEEDAEGLISTLPLPDLIEALDPKPPAPVRDAARMLKFRNLCLVALMTTEEAPFDDNWIYLHDPNTTAGRVQNFGAWSPDMVRPGTTCLGVEYFCFPSDDIWRMSDTEAVELATAELAGIGLLDPDLVTDGVKVRVPNAYPMYDGNYREAVAEIRGYLESFSNLETCGRNGLHRYNNQDHSMSTAIFATLNLIDGGDHDIWSVDQAGEYLEAQGDASAALEALDLLG